MSIPFTEKRWLLIIMAVAAAVRLYGLTAFSLSNDELSALARLRFDSFSSMISGGVYPDYHPAGVQSFLYLWTTVFGSSEWVVRLPFALLGIGSVYLLYRIGKEWFGPASGLSAAAALAVLEFPLLYSQIARPYSPGLFFTLLATLCWTRLLFDRNVTGKQLLMRGLWFSLAVSACMYIHYFSFIFAGLLCLTGLFFLRKDTIRYYIGAGVLIVLLYLPHLGVFMHQLAKGGVGGAEGWLGPPDSSTFGKYLNYGFNDSETLKYIFIAVFFGSVLAFKGRYTRNRFHLLCLIFFLVPFAVAYYYSIYRNPVLQYSVLLFSFPYILLLAFSFMPRDAGGLTRSFITAMVLLSCSWSSFALNKYYSKQHFTEFRGIAERVLELEARYGHENIAKAINIHDPYYIHYYLDRLGSDTRFGVYRVNAPEEVQAFTEYIEKSEEPYFIFAFSNMYDDPKFDMMVRARYPYLVERDSMLNSGLRLYSRAPSSSDAVSGPDHLYGYGFEDGAWPSEQDCLDTLIFHSGKRSVRLDPSREWGPTFASKLSDFKAKGGSRIELSALFRSESLPVGAKLVLSVDKNSKTVVWSGEDIGKYLTAAGQWSRVYMVVDLPAELDGTEEFKIYCWNEKKEKVWMDDVSVSVYGSRR